MFQRSADKHDACKVESLGFETAFHKPYKLALFPWLAHFHFNVMYDLINEITTYSNVQELCTQSCVRTTLHFGH